MKHSHKEKIEVLNNILTEYAKYFVYFDECKCYDVVLRFVILFKGNEDRSYRSLTRKIPRDQIDVVVARYRSKLSYEIEKSELKHTLSGIKTSNRIRNIPYRVLN